MKGDVETALIVRKVLAGTIYKLLLYGLMISFIPLGLFFGVLGFFGADTVKWNNHPIHGVAAIFAGPAIGFFISVILTGLAGSFASLGLWLLSKFRPIGIRFVALHAEPEVQQGVQADVHEKP